MAENVSYINLVEAKCYKGISKSNDSYRSTRLQAECNSIKFLFFYIHILLKNSPPNVHLIVSLISEVFVEESNLANY